MTDNRVLLLVLDSHPLLTTHITMSSIVLVAIALLVSTAARSSEEIDEEYKFRLKPDDTRLSTAAEESAATGHTWKAYDYRSNNGIVSPIYLAPGEGYQTFQDRIRKFQILSIVNQSGKNSSDSEAGTSVENIQPQNIITAKTVESSEYIPSTDPGISNSDGHFRDQYNLYSNSYGQVRYVLAPQFGYHTYGGVIPQVQVQSNMFNEENKFLDPNLNNGKSLGGKKEENSNVLESKALNTIEETNATKQIDVKPDHDKGTSETHPIVRYILDPHVGHQWYGGALPQIQIHFNTVEQNLVTSTPKLNNGSSLGGKKKGKANVSETVDFFEGQPSNRIEETNSAKQINVEPEDYKDNSMAHSIVGNILSPHVGFQRYRGVIEDNISPIRILSDSMEQGRTAPAPKSNNGTNVANKERNNAGTSEATLESQQLSKNSNLIFNSGNPFNLKTPGENNNNNDFKETKMLEQDISNTSAVSTVFEGTSPVTSGSPNRKPEESSLSYADFLTTSLKMYHNEFPLYWIANHPSIGTNDLSNSYFVSNHVTYPIAPLYYHLVL